jgi:hypothetical protein
MGSLQQPLQPGTVLRFGSLEFVSLDDSYDMILIPPPGDSDNGGRQSARRWRNRRRLPRVVEEQPSSSSRPLSRRQRGRRGNQGQAGGSASLAVERVDANQEVAPQPASLAVERVDAKQEAAPRWLSSELAPQRGAHRVSTSRLRRRRAPSPRDTPIPSKRTTPARSRKACWTSPSYLRRQCSQSTT